MDNVIKEEEAAIGSTYQKLQACGAHPDILGLFEQCAFELMQSKRQDAKAILDVIENCARGIIGMKKKYETEAEETKQKHKAEIEGIKQQARDHIELQLKDLQACHDTATGEVHKARAETRRVNSTISSLESELNRPSTMIFSTQTWFNRWNLEREENTQLKAKISTWSPKIQDYESTKANAATIAAQLRYSEAELSKAHENFNATAAEKADLLARIRELTTCKPISPASYDSAETKVFKLEAILKSL